MCDLTGLEEEFVEKRIKRDLIMSDYHKCDSCTKTIPECDAKKIQWGIDRNPLARGKEADMVLECDAHDPVNNCHNGEKTDGYCPSCPDAALCGDS